MRAKNFILIGVIIIGVIIAGYFVFQTPPDSQPQQNQGERILEIQLEISAPFSTATLLVSSQGVINYEASAPLAGVDKQTDSIKITSQQFNNLANLIVENNFWSFKEQYTDENLMDATTYTLSVKSVSTYQPELADARVYSISCYGDCPEKIVEIINKIKELYGKDVLEVGV